VQGRPFTRTPVSSSSRLDHRPASSETESSHYTPPPPDPSSVRSPQLPSAGNELKIVLKDSIYSGYAKVFVINNNKSANVKVGEFLNNCRRLLVDTLLTEASTSKHVKFQLLLEVFFLHPSGEISTKPYNFKSSLKSISLASNRNEISQQITQSFDSILSEIEELQTKGSGWTLWQIAELQLRISKSAMSYVGKKYVKLPKNIPPNTVINPRNTDLNCFKHAVVCKFYTGKSKNPRVSDLEKIEHTYDFSDLTVPTEINQICKFEKRNPKTCVNVFLLDIDCKIYPLRISDTDESERNDVIDLLYISTGPTSGHYVYIKDFDKLIKAQLLPGNTKAHIKFCKRCFSHKKVDNKEQGNIWILDHLKYCRTYKPSQIILPTEGAIMKFRNSQMHLFNHIVCYADLETTLKSVSDAEFDPERIKSYHRVRQIHEPNSFCFYIQSTLPESIVSAYKIPSKPMVYKGEKAVEDGLKDLVQLSKNVAKLYNKITPMTPLTEKEAQEFEEANHCTLCQQLYTERRTKTRHHCHCSGKYIGHYCKTCNLNMKKPTFIPIMFHNGSRYDFAFIIKALSKLGYALNVIPSNSERFLSFTAKIEHGVDLRFIDSFNFLSESLQKLVDALPKECFIRTTKFKPPELSEEMLYHKGFYPYGHITDIEVLNQTSLPPKEAFYNDLTQTHITNQDYKVALQVWKELKCKTMWDYHSHYLIMDTLLLSDVFEEFRRTIYETYKLDVTYSLSSAMFSWDAMLLTSQVELSLVTDYNMHMTLEAGLRGGLCQVNQRYAKANCSDLMNPEDYEPDKPTSRILYFDINSMYASAMTNNLPVSDFKWVSDLTELQKNWLTMSANDDKGYILVVDIKVPTELHKKLDSLPPLPVSQRVPGTTQKKLLATLEDKTHYVCHISLLQQAASFGLIVTKIHSAIEFSQRPFLKKYVELNARLRQKAKTPFHKSFFKLLTNSIFGKSIQNNRKKVNVKIVTDAVQFIKETSKINFKGFELIDKNIAIVTLAKRQIELNRPIYLGCTILDLSKVNLYDLYYNVICKLYKSHTFLYCDTDSCIIHVEEKNVLEKLAKEEYRQFFDFSNVDKKHPLYSDHNAGKLGIFKEETGLKPIYEFVALKPKMYSYRFSSQSTYIDENGIVRDKHTLKKAKGVPRSALANHILFNDYKKALFEDESIYTVDTRISCRKHRVFTEEVKKLALTNTYNKRYILPNGVSSLAYGNVKILEDNC